jgi:hypothetical protein
MTSKCANNECVVSTAPDFTKCSTSGNGMCSEGECQPLVAIRSAITENAETPYIQASTANLQLAANGRSIGPFETFLQCRVSGSSYAFRSYETKRFVTVHADGYVYADGGSTLRTATTFQVSGSNIRLTDGSGAYLECQPLNSGNEHAGKLERQSTPHAPTFWEDLPIDPGTWTVP